MTIKGFYFLFGMFIMCFEVAVHTDLTTGVLSFTGLYLYTAALSATIRDYSSK